MTTVLEYLKVVRKNAGVSLLILNLLLLAVLFFLQDPFEIFRSGYVGAKPLLDVGQADVRKIEIIDPDLKSRSVLVRQGKLPAVTPASEEKKSKTKEEESYAWQLQILDTGDKKTSGTDIGDKSAGGKTADGKTEPVKYEGDEDHIARLFESLKKARRYYSLKYTPDKDRNLHFGIKKGGDCDCLHLKFALESGRTHILYLGKSGGAESYVRLDDENEIYLVQTNIKTTVGQGQKDFFRNRLLLPRQATKKSITAIQADFGSTEKDVSLTRSGKEWHLLSPLAGKARTSAVNSLLDDIIAWRANSFPDKPPRDLETKKAFSLKITFKRSLTESHQVVFRILGLKDYSTYYLEDEKGTLYEITSVFLSDLYEARTKFLERQKGAPALKEVPGE